MRAFQSEKQQTFLQNIKKNTKDKKNKTEEEKIVRFNKILVVLFRKHREKKIKISIPFLYFLVY